MPLYRYKDKGSLMADGRIDGHFVINKGGITHGIAEELGLSASDCKKMGSVWNEVINELNNAENYTIENNGNNNGLDVQVGAVVKFSQDCWQRIISIVNIALNKDIKAVPANTLEDNLEVGHGVIERFNSEFPNVESSTLCGAKARYLENNGGNQYEINELNQRAEELDRISCQELENEVDLFNKTVLNCGDRARILTTYLKEQGINDVQEITIMNKNLSFENGEHAFNVIGLAPNADTKDPTTWGENAIVIDAWLGKVFTPQEALEHYKDLFGYENVNNIQTGTMDDIQNLFAQRHTPTSYDEIESQDTFYDENGEKKTPYNTKDARGLDISNLQLSKEQLLILTIDETTVLSDEQMEILKPVMENMKDPGLNIRSLHQRGINGQGVRIAIIDGAITNHPEFSNRVIDTHNFSSTEQDAYHGNVVSSVAVGEECGVAPGAELAFYSASTCADYTKAIERIIQQNEEYRQNGEPIISVISISCGFDKCDDYATNDNENYNMLRETITKAKEAGIVVITCDPKDEYANFAGADRNPLGDPNNPSNYNVDRFHSSQNGEWWIDKPNEEKEQTIFIPTEHRTVASEGEEYRYEGAFGGDSWGAPYIAGVFALAKQVKPDITYEEFEQVMQETANDIYNEYNGKNVYMGRLINPEAIINNLQQM